MMIAHWLRGTIAGWFAGLASLVEPPPLVACTGVSAHWCPVHGDCVCTPACPSCRRCGPSYIVKQPGVAPFHFFECRQCGAIFEHIGDFDRDDPACPLHSLFSEHAIDADAVAYAELKS